MEPPAKRLRILQSVEVDETNPDYVHAKQKQQQKFKGRLESIFAKYESMHESMSDEIDMRENKVVVDRGHLRRLVRQANRKETILLDNLGLAAGKELEEDQPESEPEEGDSEDELAPTQPVKSSSGRTKRKRSEEVTNTTGAHSSPCASKRHTSQLSDVLAAPVLPSALQAVPNTPSAAANLLQLVQFPQTPAGQQAQTSFYATLAQTINQAVQQAVAPLFSGVLSRPPNVHSPFAQPLGLPATPVVSNDNIAPATDPKWFFPPLSAESKSIEVAPSSPLLPTKQQRKPEVEVAEVAGQVYGEEELQSPVALDEEEEPNSTTISIAALRQPDEQTESSPKNHNRRTSPRAEVQYKRRRTGRTGPKYNFTEEDDIYISRQRVLHKRPWQEIKDSKEKWSKWSMSIFHHRWSTQLNGRDLHLKSLQTMETVQGDRQSTAGSEADLPSNHLPTPSSLGRDDGPEPVAHLRPKFGNDLPTSSTHFDEAELELLSLAGAASDEEQLLNAADVDEPFFPDADEMILPSVEVTGFVNEDTLQQGLLDDPPAREATPIVETAVSTKIKIESAWSSPISKRKTAPKPITYQAVSDSEVEDDDVELPGLNSSPKTGNLQRHLAEPRSAHDELRLQSGSLDLVGDDELQASASATPPIKREFSTPPPTSFVFSTPTPQSRSRAEVPSSGVKSASGLSRKAYLKQVKQSWTKRSTPRQKGLAQRKSFHTLPRKRAWLSDASEDELGL
ncbi:hypothetical protein EK21DRAFT_66439 [Setomelanomma holmii]|uniref:Scm3 multi-domain protein n=1 Tax=Setomelanomma holmii TaxID=210430 RepID=A0A9P4H910_9PLEO|nr:hypothetical protein EK21DRAFT_66439 [Setomelanomma holmii]